jgi:hypothetical protein
MEGVDRRLIDIRLSAICVGSTKLRKKMNTKFLNIIIFSVACLGISGCKEQTSQPSNLEVKTNPNFNPETCVFQYYGNDKLGKTLAESATEECLTTQGNLGAAYHRWRDHFNSERASRDNERNMITNNILNEK